MKKFLGTNIFILVCLFSFSQTQNTIKGKIVDEKSNQPVAAATVIVNDQTFVADENGIFYFKPNATNKYQIKVSSIGYAAYKKNFTVSSFQQIITIPLKSLELMLQPLEVKSLRAGNTAPFAKTNISKEELDKINIAQDLPVLLNQTPSLYISSDAGNGVGYTYMHIRGSDATRINVTLNGIPYNDAESMGTYFVDLPDFSSSVNSIQIQRGVGTSSNGAGSFGATINLLTNEFNEKSYVELNNSFGSFNTWKNTLKFGSGLLGKHFTIDGRVSSIRSDGYIDRATSNLKSLALSAAYYNKNSSLRFNFFMGKEKTYQAWYGIDSATLATDRRYNPAGYISPGNFYNNQTDNYWQNHYQLFFNHTFNKSWSFNTAVFLTFGKGYYEEYVPGDLLSNYGIAGAASDTSDVIRRRWLKNYFYGQIFSVQYKQKNDEINIGGGWTNYLGKHFGDVIWTSEIPVTNVEYYNYPANKADMNIYAKWQRNLSGRWQSFVDMQYRYVYHGMTGFEGSPNFDVYKHFNFFNPKLGISYHYNGLQVYASYAMGHKEPDRTDFQEGAVTSTVPVAERLNDFELGIEKKSVKYNFSANGYFMDYKNQLVLIGIINLDGSYPQNNVPKSYRMGLELQGGYIFTKWLHASANLSISRNKIKNFTEYIDNWDTGGQETVEHKNTDISFSPNIIGGATVKIIPAKSFEINLLSKYVGKQYLDNTQDNLRSLKEFFTEDVRCVYTLKAKWLKEVNIIGEVNNIFNNMYVANGWTYPYYSGGILYNSNGYLPMAGTNFMVALNIKL